MKCPNCQIEKEKMNDNFQFKSQYSRGSGYFRCIWCDYIIKDEKLIIQINNEYYGV